MHCETHCGDETSNVRRAVINDGDS